MPRLKLLGGGLLEAQPGIAHAISARRHPVALLALLATAPDHALSRSRLAGLLWPEVPEETARNRLGTCVHQVRKALGAGTLLSVGTDLRYDPAALPCDIVDFHAALEAASYGTAVELYAGPFLDGFSLDTGAGFEHYIDRERDRLRREYLRALEALADEADTRGDYAAAAAWWRERMADDPHDSRIVARLMESLTSAGSRAEALRVATTHERLLEDEFGTEPDARLRDLVERIRSSRAPSPAGERAGPPGETGSNEDLSRSIAVLPFDNLSGTSEAEPFVLGLHDDLLTELSRIPGLTVISRTSVQRYRVSDRPVRDIARELRVGSVLEGSVQVAEDRVRLNVQLINAHTDAHRWSERYDRRLTTESILDIQSELALRIANTLRGELVAVPHARAAADATFDIDAYRLCIQGRALLDRRTRLEMERSIDYFQRAIDRDREYALAWSGMADALSLLEFYDYPAPASAADPMDAARRAVRLAPESGPAHAALGTILAIRQDGAAALRELETAVALAPGHAEPHTWLAWVHLLRGQPERALDPARRAVELDPLAPALRAYLAETMLALGDAREALGEARRGSRIQPEYGLVHFVEGLVLHHLGRNDAAAAALQTAFSLVPPRGTPTHAEIHAVMAVVRAAAGDEAGARERLDWIRESGHALAEGLVLSALRDVDAAFAAFERVRDWNSFSNEFFRYFFPDVLGPLRQQERYQRIIRRIDRRWGVPS